jgi:hypothetical protein
MGTFQKEIKYNHGGGRCWTPRHIVALARPCVRRTNQRLLSTARQRFASSYYYFPSQLTTPAAAFVVTISALFGLMAFGLPLALAAQSRCGRNECAGLIDTHAGPLSAAAAGIQIALIPVAVVVGLVGFIVLAT